MSMAYGSAKKPQPPVGLNKTFKLPKRNSCFMHHTEQSTLNRSMSQDNLFEEALAEKPTEQPNKTILTPLTQHQKTRLNLGKPIK